MSTSLIPDMWFAVLYMELFDVMKTNNFNGISMMKRRGYSRTMANLVNLPPALNNRTR
jgi:hypothetical protein